MLNFILIEEMISLIKTLGDNTRLNILRSIRQKPKTVSKLKKELNKSQSTISQKLKTLYDENLIEFEKKGKRKKYFLKQKNIFKILSLVENYIYNQNQDKFNGLNEAHIFEIPL